MRDAKSILLRRWLTADEVDHGDCKSLQIVCPACSEALFKAVRGETHYFAHYGRDAALVAECERRIDGVPAVEKARINAAARDQRLKHFLSVLADAIGKMGDAPGTNWMKWRRNVLSKKAFRSMSLDLWTMLSAKATRTESAAFLHKLTDKYAGHYGDQMRFSIEAHKEIAFDIWNHLLTDQARKNFDNLFAAGLGQMTHKLLETAQRQGASGISIDNMRLIQCLEAIMRGGMREGEYAVSMLKSVDIKAPDGTVGPAYVALLSALAYEMAGVLLSLPYLDMLKAWRSANA